MDLTRVGVGWGAIGVSYALVEWEKTLQLIGVVGLGQTLYQRVNSYQDEKDLKDDISCLLQPPVVAIATAAATTTCCSSLPPIPWRPTWRHMGCRVTA
ncbi:hypothetical protein Taro_019502 [Colocasia esculenta]|uniref:Uncharacterized protein n=1 Tax=Colocasia esculenta TaxID=4460 RepID=A0A843UZH5_COLES|nr:hypothetical protein [Colocasia esculenta]